MRSTGPIRIAMPGCAAARRARSLVWQRAVAGKCRAHRVVSNTQTLTVSCRKLRTIASTRGHSRQHKRLWKPLILKRNCLRDARLEKLRFSSHNPKVAGSNPAPATRKPQALSVLTQRVFESSSDSTVLRTFGLRRSFAFAIGSWVSRRRPRRSSRCV